jgi:hypothetical protein
MWTQGSFHAAIVCRFFSFSATIFGSSKGVHGVHLIPCECAARKFDTAIDFLTLWMTKTSRLRSKFSFALRLASGQLQVAPKLHSGYSQAASKLPNPSLRAASGQPQGGLRPASRRPLASFRHLYFNIPRRNYVKNLQLDYLANGLSDSLDFETMKGNSCVEHMV